MKSDEPIDIAASVEKFRRELPSIIASLELMAVAQRAKFEFLRRAGFTEAQALELCKTIA